MQPAIAVLIVLPILIIGASFIIYFTTRNKKD